MNKYRNSFLPQTKPIISSIKEFIMKVSCATLRNICRIMQINRKQHTYSLIDAPASRANRIIVCIVRIHRSHRTRDSRQRTTALGIDTQERREHAAARIDVGIEATGKFHTPQSCWH